MGGSYLQRNLNSLAVDGRLFVIGFMGGTVTEVNLQPMLARRLTIQGCTDIECSLFITFFCIFFCLLYAIANVST
jgi:NADPH:quinone reductase-like Zn-dependent oxidoreductase